MAHVVLTLRRRHLPIGLIAVLAACGPDPAARKVERSGPCIDCHANDVGRATLPDHRVEGFPSDCSQCHDQQQWSPAHFDHEYPLAGRHAEVGCASCHQRDPVPVNCIGCHDADRSRPTAPDHLADGFPSDCTRCHTTDGWKPAAFDHTKFRLAGKHTTLACASCHDRQPLPTTCVGCHEADRGRPQSPDHRAAGFPTDCSQCHGFDGWTPTTFDHGFPLQGGHAAVACGSCHSGAQTPSIACIGCHDADRSRPTDPDHRASGFPTDCTRCHTTAAWKPAAYEHTKFPLDGQHVAAACDQCHTTQDAPPSACVGCHEQDRSRPTLPDHGALSTDCRQCHTTAGWRPAEFVHDAFALVGNHATVACSGCHDRTPVPTTCIGCHDADRSRPLDPDHLNAGFPTDCARCHSPEGWKGVTLNCTSCHGGATSPAPPAGVNGQTSTDYRGVGAHQQHLAASNWRAPVLCQDCHRVPTSANDPGHTDTTLPADVDFAGSGIAGSDGANPQWNGTTLTCSGSYCHGATLSGGLDTAPEWTVVDGSQRRCISCHGMPPTDGHPASGLCGDCHGAVVDANLRVTAPELHINGKVEVSGGGGHPSGWSAPTVHGPAFYGDVAGCRTCHGTDLEGGSASACSSCHPSNWQTDCTFCHGDSDPSGAPPEAVDGATATSDPGVGAHAAHLTASTTHAAYACGTCHQVPTTALSSGHIDPSPADVRFAGLAAGGSYDVQAHGCTVYCHGNGRAGSSGSVSWTGSLSGCDACHASSRSGLSGSHQDHSFGCATCHACVVSSNTQIADASRHVDGTRDVCGSNIGWNATSRSCNPSCHGSENW